MAEIFGAVASGAGLASLALQLVDTAQKLKTLYNAVKDAPHTVEELTFELETMSLSLLQLASHRNTNVAGDELLGRCVVTCTRAVKKITGAVAKIECLIQRGRIGGRLYMAFKQPEIRELLEELERAKSSMSFAYMSYCHSWSLGESARIFSTQRDVASLQIAQLSKLESTIQDGNSMVLGRLSTKATQFDEESRDIITSRPLASRGGEQRTRNRKRQPFRRFRISLPRCFVDCVWEFGLRASNKGWDIQLRPVNTRPQESFVFNVVRSGSVPAVRALLESGSLSERDQAAAPVSRSCQSLLEIAAENGHLELCTFLLDQYSYFCDDAMMHSALDGYIMYSQIRGLGYEDARKEADDMYDLFMERHGLLVLVTDNEYHDMDFVQSVESNMLLTETSLRTILAGQFSSAREPAFELKFPVAMRSTGWPAKSFLEFLKPCSPAQLVTTTDKKGRTTMHWASKHFGYWVCTRRIQDDCPDGSKTKSYATLLETLVAMGGDVHALNNRNETPLMVLLNHFATIVDWESCSRVVKQWGQILSRAGLDLNDYLHTENSLLRLYANQCRIADEEIRDIHPSEVQLVFEGSGLAVKVKFCRLLTVWKQYVPPGTWDLEPKLPQISVTGHSHAGEGSCVWHEAAKVSIFSDSYLVKEIPKADRPFWSSENFEEFWLSMFKGVQDDHGPTARAMMRDLTRSETKKLTPRSRASSVPSRTKLQVCDRLPTLRPAYLQVNLGHQHWMPTVYKCPFELGRSWFAGTPDFGESWTITGPQPLNGLESRDIWERLEATDDWVVQLLREHGEVDAVRNFADRFCPDLINEVEQELAEARSIAELSARCT